MFDADPVLRRCAENQITFLFEYFSSLDRYFGLKDGGAFYLVTDANLVALAKAFENIEFPGLEATDASLINNGNFYFFRCVDMINTPPPQLFTIQNLYYDPGRNIFIDNHNCYQDLRGRKLTALAKTAATWKTIMDAAQLKARYGLNGSQHDLQPGSFCPPPSLLAQRLLLANILLSRYSAQGLELLLETGFIQEFWPEIYKMLSVPQMKDFHPEGNVWEHALECLKHRKIPDITLSLALLLHDLGKTIAQGDREKPYQNHTELGVSLSYRFLKRLEFPPNLIADVTFLIRYHMMPAAIHKMPLYRIRDLLKSPLFPLLLELYRADIESTFQKPDAYYLACRIYRSFLKRESNPYKSFNLSKSVLSQ